MRDKLAAGFHAHMILYLLLAITFSAIQFSFLDEHYTLLVRERYELGGTATFATSRILSIVLLRFFTIFGLSIEASSYILTVLTLTGILYAFRAMLEVAGELPSARSILLAPFIIVPIFWNYTVLSEIMYPEDFPAMLLFMLGLLFLYKEKSSAFHLVFLLAALNRESSIFLLPAMLILQIRKRRLSSLLLHLLVLAAIWAVIKAARMHFFGGGIDAPYYVNSFKYNIIYLKSMLNLKPEGLSLLCMFGGLWLAIPFCFGKVPPRVLVLTIMFPFFFAVMLLAGNLNGELRIFNEMVPVITAPAVLLFSRYLPDRC